MRSSNDDVSPVTRALSFYMHTHESEYSLMYTHGLGGNLVENRICVCAESWVGKGHADKGMFKEDRVAARTLLTLKLRRSRNSELTRQKKSSNSI